MIVRYGILSIFKKPMEEEIVDIIGDYVPRGDISSKARFRDISCKELDLDVTPEGVYKHIPVEVCKTSKQGYLKSISVTSVSEKNRSVDLFYVPYVAVSHSRLKRIYKRKRDVLDSTLKISKPKKENTDIVEDFIKDMPENLKVYFCK